MLADGRTALVIGDVTGHDSYAAAAMAPGPQRAARGRAQQRRQPAQVLTGLDAAMRDLAIGTLATAVLATVEQTPADAARGARVLRWSNAGHPPPLLVLPDGTVEVLERPADLLLGVDPTRPRADHEHELPPGSTVLLYTDGLIERRGVPLDDGVRWLCAWSSSCGTCPWRRSATPCWPSSTPWTTTSRCSPSAPTPRTSPGRARPARCGCPRGTAHWPDRRPPIGHALPVPDPAELRRRVLAAWADSPARFREDANAEEDLVRGGYRDRLVVELAQNAADAAARAGVPGPAAARAGRRTTLRAANTGAPLDDDGVQALATLRASAKRDEPAQRRPVRGRLRRGPRGQRRAGGASPPTAGCGSAPTATRAAVAARPGAGRRAGAPRRRRARAAAALRPPTAPPPAGSPRRSSSRCGRAPPTRSAARWPTCDADAAARAARAGRDRGRLDGAARTLAATRRPTSRLTDGDADRLAGRASAPASCPTALLADRPVEERDRRGWTVTWAVPVDDDGVPAPLPGRQVVHAPTPSDEPLSLPARLIAPFPLGPDRRHVAPGPVTDALVAAAADAYAELLAGAAARPGAAARSCHGPGWRRPSSTPRCARAVLDRLRATRLAAARPARGAGRRRPDRAVALDDATDERVAALAGVLPGLLPAGWSRRRTARCSPPSASGGPASPRWSRRCAACSGPADWWAALYAALDGADREELAALPVPLADGRTAHGPAGVLLPTSRGLPAERLAPARPADGRPGRGRPAGRPAGAGAARCAARRRRPRCSPTPTSAPPWRARWSRDDVDGEDVEPLAVAVLALVAAAGTAPGELPWLAELALPDDDGGWAPAGELVRPGSPLADVLAPGALGALDPEFAADPGRRRAAGRRRARQASRCSPPTTPTTWTSTGSRSGSTRCWTGCRPTRRRRRGRR